MPSMIPLTDLDRRAPEAGRIRLGVKAGRAMKSIDTFRFTSPHEAAIKKLADLHGGEARPWSDPKANKGQWEVITEAKALEVIVQPGGLSVNYELWGGGGCQRRCDGVEAQVPSRDPNEMYEYTACICNAQGKAECRPYTRLQVVLPDLNFYGVWRMESKGWNVAKELPGMFDMVTELTQSGHMVRAMLHLEQRTSVSGGQTKHFVVPTMSIAATPEELMSGGGKARPQLEAGTGEAVAELGSGEVHLDPERDNEGPGMPDEIVEAQVVDVDLENKLEEQIREIAIAHKLDPSAVVATIWDMTNGDYTKLERFIVKSHEGKTLSFTQAGRLKWTS